MDTILIVDDADEQLELHKKYLEGKYQVVCCKNGEEALNLLVHITPQLILLDIEMPIMNGYVVLENIRKMDRHMNVPVIGLTGNNSKASVLSFLSKGGNEYLIKPVAKENLLEKIDMVLTEERKKRGQKKILIVDDELESLFLFKSLLKDIYSVAVLNAGKMVIDYLSKNRPDLILLDYHMTPFSGVSLFRMIRNMDAYKEIPIAFITGCHDKESLLECAKLLPAGVFLKPIEQEELLNKIKEILG